VALHLAVLLPAALEDKANRPIFLGSRLSLLTL
jgi:hypothetical protein